MAKAYQDKTLEHDLTIELNRLHQRVSRSREAGADPLEITQTTNLFEIAWLERLPEKRRVAELSSQYGIELSSEKQAQEQRLANGVRDNARLVRMRPENQVAYANASPPHSSIREHERAQQVEADIGEAKASIGAYFSQLNYSLVKAIVNIEHGQEPNFLALISQQMTGEQAPAQEVEPVSQAVAVAANGHHANGQNGHIAQETWAEYQARRGQQTLAPERSVQERDQELNRGLELEK